MCGLLARHHVEVQSVKGGQTYNVTGASLATVSRPRDVECPGTTMGDLDMAMTIDQVTGGPAWRVINLTGSLDRWFVSQVKSLGGSRPLTDERDLGIGVLRVALPCKRFGIDSSHVRITVDEVGAGDCRRSRWSPVYK